MLSQSDKNALKKKIARSLSALRQARAALEPPPRKAQRPKRSRPKHRPNPQDA